MSEQELIPSTNFFTKVNMPQAPMSLEAIVESKRRIQKLIIRLTRERNRSKELKTKHSKDVKIDSLKLILEYYELIQY